MLSVSIFPNLPQKTCKFQCSAYLGQLSFPKRNPSQLAQIWLSPLMKLCFNIHEGSNFTQVTWELQWWNVTWYVWVVGNHPQLDQLEYWSTKLWSSISTGEIEHMFGSYQLYILQMLLGSRFWKCFHRCPYSVYMVSPINYPSGATPGRDAIQTFLVPQTFSPKTRPTLKGFGHCQQKKADYAISCPIAVEVPEGLPVTAEVSLPDARPPSCQRGGAACASAGGSAGARWPLNWWV